MVYLSLYGAFPAAHASLNEIAHERDLRGVDLRQLFQHRGQLELRTALGIILEPPSFGASPAQASRSAWTAAASAGEGSKSTALAAAHAAYNISKYSHSIS